MMVKIALTIAGTVPWTTDKIIRRTFLCGPVAALAEDTLRGRSDAANFVTPLPIASAPGGEARR
jgi:hypothetical protein